MGMYLICISILEAFMNLRILTVVSINVCFYTGEEHRGYHDNLTTTVQDKLKIYICVLTEWLYSN